MSYAENTKVPVAKSRADLEQTLQRYGADAFSYGYDRGQAIVAFRVRNVHVKLRLRMPRETDEDMVFTPAGQRRSDGSIRAAMQQEERRRWRALGLIVKAKLEGVESGVETFEEAFLAHIMLPDGSTVADSAVPAILRAYETGKMPTLLPGGTD